MKACLFLPQLPDEEVWSILLSLEFLEAVKEFAINVLEEYVQHPEDGLDVAVEEVEEEDLGCLLKSS